MTVFARQTYASLNSRSDRMTTRHITGLPGGSKSFYLTKLIAEERTSLVIVTGEDLEAEGLSADFEAWSVLTPPEERPAVIYVPEYNEAMRIAALGRFASEKQALLICSKATFEKPVFTPSELKTQTLELRPGQEYPRTQLLEKIAQGGFTRSDLVELEGEMAVRGEVVDIWPAGIDKPWRLLFDGDTLESIREFSPGIQRSEGYLNPQKLLPFKEAKPTGTLASHISDHVLWFWDDLDPSAGVAEYRSIPRYSDTILYKGLAPASATDLGFKSTTGLVAGMDRAAEETKKALKEKRKVIFFSHNVGESERLQELLEERLGSHGTAGVEFLVGPLRSGFFNDKILVVTNSEIFGRYRHRPRLPKFKGGGAIREIQDIKPGDYAVHEYYGIGRYRGLELLHAGGHDAEYLKLEYAKGDRLYVPLYDFKQVQKYSGSEGNSPRLSSLDSSAWERVKARVKESIQELARDLVKVHALRAALPGHAFPADSHLEQEFAASFLYEETPDQTKAIAEVKKDMEGRLPMDRLILGDVGYGKTEVAMRAAMKAISDSKQVAVLVPTTILAEQHFRTFTERFADYPARIGMLSRFQTAKEEKDTLAAMAVGAVDIVVGTHKLLQKGIKFHDLGLLIIDEEHRFGVKHKEQIKKIRERLDVLTMTATPIPRTLSFALSGMRELSIIESPPAGRLPITTHVGPYEDTVVREAMQKELERKGQVFYVHNRVQSLNTRLHFLKALMPGVSIGVVHGQMTGPAIEKVMWEFTHRKHDILLATTIIESGIDIPSANTLIVEEAEDFGLSQLYQLRGRVGRERTKAYCYLFYSGSVPLTQDARARLEALREFTELGSGYRLAVRDMEIRGAGNLLGQQQHGHIAAVGLDLYSQLLQEEISRLKGEAIAAPVRFPSMDLSVHAFLPADYLPSEEMRVLFYKKLVSANDSVGLEAVQAELEDRFGALPNEAKTLLEVSRLRIMARDIGIDGIVQKPSSLEIRFLQNTQVSPPRLVGLSQERAGLRFKAGPPFTLIIDQQAYASMGPIRYLSDLFDALHATRS
jgi:transcription-repair coupling factor (superfamily II helicase)